MEVILRKYHFSECNIVTLATASSKFYHHYLSHFTVTLHPYSHLHSKLIKVDLRSDTVTKPSAEMRQAMANAEVLF